YANGGNIENVHHEDLANHYGVPIDESGNYLGHSLGQTVSDGTIKMLTRDASHTPQEVQGLLSQHFPEYRVMGLPEAGATNEDRWRKEIAEQEQKAKAENFGVEPAGSHPWYERQLPGFADRKRQELEDVKKRGR